MSTKIRKPFTQIRVSKRIVGKSMTDQSQKDACCIHKVLAQYDKTGVLTHVNRYQPMYDDVSDITDYQSALVRVKDTQNAFDGLPSEVRQRFMNDPMKFVEFMADPSNRDEAIKLGLVRDNAAPKGGESSATHKAGETNPPTTSTEVVTSD